MCSSSAAVRRVRWQPLAAPKGGAGWPWSRASCVTYPVRSVAGAYVLGNDIGGTAKLVVDEERRVVVGATFTGPGLQELLHSATVAIAGQVPLETLWHAVPSSPR
jgi:pyruvate/2-oxoglutarate dehydrogenase complex dihydrolipoamide dehydrogenase (E3) component